LVISDGAKPALVENMITDNLKEGISIQAAAPSIQKNTIARNMGFGINVHRSNALITENNIIDNRPLDINADMTGESVNALNNWWGSIGGLDILSRIKGRINIVKILNDSYPTGKTTDLPILDSLSGRTIDKDSFLIMSNSPYKIDKDVLIKGGATLYIEPGIILLYGQNKAITVEDGGIIARGTLDMPIFFTASGASPLPGYYASAVRFIKPTKVISVFSYCNVKYAETAFDIHYGTPEISHCFIAANSQSGIFCRNDASPKITYNTFSNNMGEGAIRSVGMSKPLINYNNFVNNAFAVQAFSSTCIDARYNWWGNFPPDEKDIFKHGEDSINLKPCLEKAEEKAFKE
jgi:hypothetical protein